MKFRLAEEFDIIDERNLTKAERHNKEMDRIFSYKKSLDSAMKDFLIKNGVHKAEAEKLYQQDKLDVKLRELGLHDEFFDTWQKKEGLKEGWYQFSYKSGSNPYIAKNEKERDKLLKKYDGKVTKIDDDFYEIDDINDEAPSSFFTESLEESGIKRYSDAYDEETRKNGWWYFTTHGYGPGTFPSDLHMLDTTEGQNEKGTWGDYIKLDGILNTDELKYYDLRELAPPQEDSTQEDDFDGFFSDYDFEESLVGE